MGSVRPAPSPFSSPHVTQLQDMALWCTERTQAVDLVRNIDAGWGWEWGVMGTREEERKKKEVPVPNVP